MPVTLIVKCPECGNFALAVKTQKTKICPYCGSKIDLQRARRVASANTAFEASEILKSLKKEKGFDKA